MSVGQQRLAGYEEKTSTTEAALGGNDRCGCSSWVCCDIGLASSRCTSTTGLEFGNEVLEFLDTGIGLFEFFLEIAFRF